MGTQPITKPNTIGKFSGASSEDSDTFELPENLGELSLEEITELHTRATETFRDVFGDGSGQFSSEGVEALRTLAAAVETLGTEISTRNEAEEASRAELAELAANVIPTEGSDSGEDIPAETPEAEEAPEEEPPAVEEAPAPAARLRVNVAGLRRNSTPVPSTERSEQPSMGDFARAGDRLSGFRSGDGLSWEDIGRGVEGALSSYDHRSYALAAKRGEHRQDRGSLVEFSRNIPVERHIDTDDVSQVTKKLNELADETLLKDGSLVAAGGWCAPSETMYDLYDIGSTTEGLLDLPTALWGRGGIRFAKGLSFAAAYADSGFYYTEAEDIAGYEGEGKPCFEVPCPSFEEVRLDVAGVCVQAGLLQARGYPEAVADAMKQTLVAHEHRVDARKLASIISGSTPVTLAPIPSVGAVAPTLAALELQAESYRYAHRLGMNVSLEVLVPVWTRAAFRADLSQRLGVDLMSVPNARVDQFFRERGLAVQYLYNFDPLSGVAATDVAFPTTLRAVMYRAGTWTAGTQGVISIDNLYDSTLLSQNDFTALFTEEGVAVAKRGVDSRVISMAIDPNGAAAMQVVLETEAETSEGLDAAAMQVVLETEAETSEGLDASSTSDTPFGDLLGDVS